MRQLQRFGSVCALAMLLLVTLTGGRQIHPAMPATPARVAASPGPRIVFLGDSLTEGAFASNQAHDYASLVTAGLHGRAVETHGQYGVGVSVVLPALVKQHAPAADIVVIELGTNDVSKPVAQFAADYGEIVGLLRRDEPSARFVCLGAWRDPNQAAPYDAVIQQMCPGAFVALSSLYMDFTLHGPQGRLTWLGGGDWFHPNNSGHAAIARAVLSALA